MPVRPPRRVGRRVAKISLVALASLILLAGLVLGGVALVLTPARLTPLVNEYASRVLNARIGFDTVSLSLVRHFPNVGVRLKGGQIVSRAFEDLPDSLRTEIPAAADTLLRFDEFTLALDLPQLLASRLVVRRIDLRRPRVYAYVAPSGRANWKIYAADTVSSARCLMLFISPTHAIWSLAFSSSVSPSVFAICAIIWPTCSRAVPSISKRCSVSLPLIRRWLYVPLRFSFKKRFRIIPYLPIRSIGCSSIAISGII